MKLFRNLLIATAAVAVMSSVSVFAEDTATEETTTDTPNYVFEVDDTKVATNVVSVASADVANVIADMGDQVTVVVVPAGSTEISDANIYYINQDANGNATVMLTDMGTKALAADTDYEVWVGGSNGTIKKGFFTTKEDAPAYTLGDINDDDVINISDVTAVLNAYLGNATLTETQQLAADVAPIGAVDGVINISDVTAVLNVYLGNATL